MLTARNLFTVSFFGHRQMDTPLSVEHDLQGLVRDLLVEKEYVEFLVGRDGEFDQLVSSTIRRCKREVRDDNSALVLVLPYLTAEVRDNKASFADYYDEIEVCPEAVGVHYKAAHQIRNHAMVDRSDLVIFWVEHCSGGAWQTLRYAEKRGGKRINLGKVQKIANKQIYNLCKISYNGGEFR